MRPYAFHGLNRVSLTFATFSNPKDYADNMDARQYDKRLRPPVRQVELDIDPKTGMKNYIANERGDWDTSSAYIKHSLSRSIHYGRVYTSSGRKGNEEDLSEALRCMGQALHTMEDFGAHTNYCELALREMGFHNVFPHTGVRTEINLHGRRVFPLVTGTFGMVDFFHSVLGEATDHFTQSEVNEMDIALGDAQTNSSGGSLGAFTGLLGKIPGTRELVSEAENLKRQSDVQETSNRSRGSRSGYSTRELGATSRSEPTQQSSSSGSSSVLPDFDPNKTIAQIYPILAFRDKVVRKLTSIIEKIPGLETAVEKISDTLTVFVMSLLAPFVRPLISAASNSLQTGSAGVIDASGKHQYEPWTDPMCTDPTHSLLSKDHFSNILNEPAGHVAAAIVKYVAPRVLYAWEHPNVPEQEVIHDCLSAFHHPAIRDMRNDAHRTMFEAVESWVHSRKDRGRNLNDILSSEGVKSGKNNGGQVGHSHGSGGHSHGSGGFPVMESQNTGVHQQQQQHQSSGSSGGSSMPWDSISKLPIPGISNLSKFSNFIPGGLARETKNEPSYSESSSHHTPSHTSHGQSSSYYGSASGHPSSHSSHSAHGHSSHQHSGGHSHSHNSGHSHEHSRHSHSHHHGSGYGGGYGGYGY